MAYDIILIIATLIVFVLLIIIKKFVSRIATLKKELQDANDNQTLLDNLPLPIFYKDENGKIIYKNSSFDISFGINTKETIGYLSKYTSKPKERITLKFDNNIEKSVSVYTSIILAQNKDKKGTIGAIFDTSGFKKDIDSLIEWKKRYSLSVDGCGYGVWDWDIVNSNIYFSLKWKEIMGYDSSEDISSLNSWLNLVDARDMARVNEALNKHLNKQSEVFIIEHRLRLSKSVKWINIRGKALFDSFGKAIRMTGLIIDISERKKIEHELSKSQKLFATFMDNLPAIAFIKDTKQRYIYLNNFYENYIGFKEWRNRTVDEIFDKQTAKNIKENDRRAFYEGVKKHEEVIPNAEGIPKYFEAYKFPIDNGNDEKLLCGFGIDITKEKVYQEKIRLYAEIFNNTSEAIIITDEKKNILIVNKAFEKSTGYAFYEVQGKNPSFLAANEQDREIFDAIDKSLEKDGYYFGEVLNTSKTGQPLPMLISANNIKSQQGKITNYFMIFQNIEEIKENEKKLKKLANYDVLTKLPNRFLFEDRLKRSITNVKRVRSKMALIFIDLDNFKAVNDTLGHDAGDFVLMQVAKKLTKSIRNNDTVARLGGDEFVMILENIKDVKSLNILCKKILQNLNVPFKLLDEAYAINASLGVSICPVHSTDYNELIKFADIAMYKAKNSGKNAAVIYNAND
ncbi:MAG: diguanylate cyclase [Epsilonproteobacteria bacterium]|nr:diguanylate cyclase [Campylobacterota bacterium]